MTVRQNTRILYMDDDADDLELLHEALQSIDPAYTMLQARDGAAGLQELQQMKAQGRLPCLIVLDINMPKMDGRQTFEKIREDAVLAAIPVVVFSTSGSDSDRGFFEEENIAYITKPFEYTLFLEAARRLLNYCSHSKST